MFLTKTQLIVTFIILIVVVPIIGVMLLIGPGGGLLSGFMDIYVSPTERFYNSLSWFLILFVPIAGIGMAMYSVWLSYSKKKVLLTRLVLVGVASMALLYVLLTLSAG